MWFIVTLIIARPQETFNIENKTIATQMILLISRLAYITVDTFKVRVWDLILNRTDVQVVPRNSFTRPKKKHKDECPAVKKSIIEA